MTAPAVSRVDFMDLGSMHEPIRGQLDEAIRRVVDRGDFILGADVEAFEAEFAGYCEVPHAVGVDSGTSALELALRAFGIGPGDEVITSANTYIATALAVTAVGARPVLVDVDPITRNIDPARIAEAITSRTRCIIPVHLYGHPAPMDEITDLAGAAGLWVLEDASQAHGARYRGRRVGGIGHVGAFSLYPSKNLGAMGDGGVIVTRDLEISQSVQLLRNWGSRVKYVHETVGWNRRLDTLQAAILRVKLEQLDGWNAARRNVARWYDDLLAERCPHIELPHTASWAEPVYHLYVVRTDRRDALQRHLAAEGISTVIHYPTPIHLQGAYADLGHRRGDFPVTELDADRVLSLPMYPNMTRTMVERVVEAIETFE